MNSNYAPADYGEKYHEHIMEQYKLYVEMADRISQRRLSTNNFFISLHTLFLAFLTFLETEDWRVNAGCAVIGVVFSITWFYSLSNYTKLNSGKFSVIHQIEKFLPLSVYESEWSMIGEGKEIKKYFPVSHIESILPIVCFAIYLFALIASFVR